MRQFVAIALVTVFASPTAAAQQAAQAGAHAGGGAHAIVALPDGIAWGPGPASLPPGARAVVLEGNPAEAGPFTLRLALPANYRISPHYHPAIEHVTVLSGTFYVGMGETFDSTAVKGLPAGAFAVVPVGMRHFALTKTETIIQLHGVGPWGLVYVNPADDPRKQRP